MSIRRKTSAKKEFTLGEDFGDVAVSVNGVRIDVRADGNVVVCTDGHVNVRPAHNDNAPPKEAHTPEIGDTMPDGTIFAGLSPDTNQPMYVAEEDAPLTMKWKQAMQYAAGLSAHGHSDWRVPTKGELNVLFQNSAAIGGFGESGSFPTHWYWSCTESASNSSLAWIQRFTDGADGWNRKDTNKLSVRCVRAEPRPAV